MCSYDHRDYLVSGFAIDIGNIDSMQSPVSWAVGFVRNPSIKYTTASGDQQERVPYYTTQYSSIDDAVMKPLHLDRRAHV